MATFDQRTPIVLGTERDDAPGVYDKALVFLGLGLVHPFVVARNYELATGEWSSGSYYRTPAEAYCDMSDWEWTDPDDASEE